MVPFSLNEWSQPKDYKHVMFLNQPDEAHQIALSFPIELKIRIK